jgi:hypothetical protein
MESPKFSADQVRQKNDQIDDTVNRCVIDEHGVVRVFKDINVQVRDC